SVIVLAPSAVVFALFVNETSSVTACGPVQAVVIFGFVYVLGVLSCSKGGGWQGQVRDNDIVGGVWNCFESELKTIFVIGCVCGEVPFWEIGSVLQIQPNDDGWW